MAADVFLYLYKGNVAIKGGSQDAIFPKSIELTSFSMDAEATIGGDEEDTEMMDRRADQLEKPFAGEFDQPEEPLDSFSIEIKKEFDRASTELFKNYALAATKQVVPFTKAEVFCRIAGPQLSPGMKPDQVCFLIYEFHSLFVYDYSLDTSEKSSIPKEKCKLYFDKYRITYRQQLASGRLGTPLSLGWDFEKYAAF